MPKPKVEVMVKEDLRREEERKMLLMRAEPNPHQAHRREGEESEKELHCTSLDQLPSPLSTRAIEEAERDDEMSTKHQIAKVMRSPLSPYTQSEPP